MQKLKNFTAASLLGISTLLPLQAVFAEETAAPTTALTTPVTTTEKAATPVPPPLAEKAPTVSEKVHNPYGLEAMWKEGDLVSKVTLFILVIMSIGTWYIIITKCLQQGKIRKQGQHADKNFWEATSLDTATEGLDDASVYRFIAEKGIKSTKNHGGTLLERIDFNTWVTISIQRAIDKIHSHLSGGLAFLATVGSTAPFVGVFGTVWGIYRTLTTVAADGQMDINAIVGPVGEALIMTAFGLAVALPALFAYNFFSRKNQVQSAEIDAFAHDLVAEYGNPDGERS